MNAVLTLIQRSRWIFLFGVPLALTVLIFAGPASGPSVATIGILLVILATTALVVITNLAGVDTEAKQQAEHLHPDPTVRALLTRWLRRSRHFRYVGGVMGFIIGVGIGDGGLGPIFLSILFGTAVGGALAELHSLSRSTSSATSASLVPRMTSDYTNRRDVLALKFVGIAGLVMALVAVFSDAVTRTPLIASIAAFIVALGTIGLQRALILRPRPALPDELRKADDLMRRLAAILGFTKPAIALGFGLLALVFDTLGETASAGEQSGDDSLIALVLWIFALGWNLKRPDSPESIAAEALA